MKDENTDAHDWVQLAQELYNDEERVTQSTQDIQQRIRRTLEVYSQHQYRLFRVTALDRKINYYVSHKLEESVPSLLEIDWQDPQEGIDISNGEKSRDNNNNDNNNNDNNSKAKLSSSSSSSSSSTSPSLPFHIIVDHDPPVNITYRRFLYLIREHPLLYIKRVARNNGVHFSQLDRLCGIVMNSLYGRRDLDIAEDRRLLFFIDNILREDFNAISQEKDRINFLRSNTFASKLLLLYCKTAQGRRVLESILKQPVMDLLQEEDPDMEIDPLQVFSNLELTSGDGMRTRKEMAEHPKVKEKIERNRPKLEAFCIKLVENIYGHVDQFPYGIRWICKQLYQMGSTIQVEENRNQPKNAIVGGFLFLRLLIPAFLSPNTIMSSLDMDMLTRVHRTRSLTAIARVVERLSNGQLYNEQRWYMQDMNSFLQRYLDRHHSFLEELVDVEDFVPDFSSERPSERCRVLDISVNDIYFLHRIFEKNRDRFDNDDPVVSLLDQLGSPPSDIEDDVSMVVPLLPIHPELPSPVQNAVDRVWIAVQSISEPSHGSLAAILDAAAQDNQTVSDALTYLDSLPEDIKQDGYAKIAQAFQEICQHKDKYRKCVTRALKDMDVLIEKTTEETQELTERENSYEQYLNSIREKFSQTSSSGTSSLSGTRKKKKKSLKMKLTRSKMGGSGFIMLSGNDLIKNDVMSRRGISSEERETVFQFLFSRPDRLSVSVLPQDGSKPIEHQLEIDDLLDQLFEESFINLSGFKLKIGPLLTLLPKKM